MASLPGFRRGSVSSTGEGEGEKGGGGERMVGGKQGRRKSRQRPASSGHAPALELPPRGGGAPPPRPPDYCTQQGVGSGYQQGRGSRVSRTQSRESGGREEEDEETQVTFFFGPAFKKPNNLLFCLVKSQSQFRYRQCSCLG